MIDFDDELDINDLILRANDGDVSAQTELGEDYFKGFWVEQDYSEAFKWLSKAATQNSAVAQRYLANCYANGLGVEQNEQKAFYWYVTSAELGNSDS